MDSLLVERSDGVVTVTLNRPERKNAVHLPMWGELLEAFREIAQSADDRVVVLTGAGDAFCSGADVGSLDGAAEGGYAAFMRHVGDVCMAMHHVPQPTIAKVRGVAVGAGMNLALACDLVVAADDARFAELFAKRGLTVDFGGSWVLPRLVGLQKAKELVLLADMVSAEQAAAMGLVNRVVDPGALDAVVAEWAAQLAAGPPEALAQSKRLLNLSFESTLFAALQGEANAQALNLGSADFAEAVTAFSEKRPAVFGRR